MESDMRSQHGEQFASIAEKIQTLSRELSDNNKNVDEFLKEIEKLDKDLKNQIDIFKVHMKL